ncbi:MAG: GNAT family N-acetyltransferase [Gemmataceae bacterium]
MPQAQPDDWSALAQFFAADALAPAATAEFLLDRLRQGAIDPAGVFVCQARGQITGLAIVQQLPGRQAGLWRPLGDPAAMLEALRWLQSLGTRVAILIQELQRPAPAAILGFRFMTHLNYLQAPPAPNPALALDHIEPYCPANEADFADVLLQSYLGSDDCPELNDDRTGAQALADYAETSESGTQEWYLRRSPRGEPAAVLLLSTQLPISQLVYLGVVPAARRQGHGQVLTRLALARTPGTMQLHVDVRNHAAFTLYTQSGFTVVDSRAVYFCILG